MFRVRGIKPFLDTVPKLTLSTVVIHVKDVFTFSCENRTVVAGDLTVWTASVKRNSTDSADIFIWDIPFPYRHGVDSFNFDLHPRSLDVNRTKRRTLNFEL
jgi:hypothetical protein